MKTSYRPTKLEIDLNVLARNVRLIRERVPATARLMAVVKADGYGHGALQVSRVAIENGADQLAVAIPEEGAQLRESGIGAPILVLGNISSEGADAIARYRLGQTVCDIDTVQWLEASASRYNAMIDVHIKIDSGMGRIGVREEGELFTVTSAVLAAKHLRLIGVYTHFAMADAEDLTYTREQASRFEALAFKLRAIKPDILLHAANSAAMLRCPALAYDMVRMGIAMYTDPCLPGDASKGLESAMRWVTSAVYVKEIARGESVSYGRQFIAEAPTRVMTLPVGYADGYHRAIGGVGRALVRGQSVPVIGRVCMDQTMLDVTDVPDAAVGDEVVLLGRQGDASIPVWEMGSWCNMIDYEVILSPTTRVAKVHKR